MVNQNTIAGTQVIGLQGHLAFRKFVASESVGSFSLWPIHRRGKGDGALVDE
jgi:hypothetical protein